MDAGRFIATIKTNAVNRLVLERLPAPACRMRANAGGAQRP
jgi:hypothetical protein